MFTDFGNLLFFIKKQSLKSPEPCEVYKFWVRIPIIFMRIFSIKLEIVYRVYTRSSVQKVKYLEKMGFLSLRYLIICLNNIVNATFKTLNNGLLKSRISWIERLTNVRNEKDSKIIFKTIVILLLTTNCNIIWLQNYGSSEVMWLWKKVGKKERRKVNL